MNKETGIEIQGQGNSVDDDTTIIAPPNMKICRVYDTQPTHKHTKDLPKQTQGQRKEDAENGDIIIWPEGAGLHRMYDMLPYTKHRIERVYKQVGMHLENVWQGYKANRRPNYKEIYNLVKDTTGEVVAREQPLDYYRCILASLDIPLYDEFSTAKDAPKPPKENPNARQFRETAAALSRETEAHHGRINKD